MKPAHWRDGVFFERLYDGQVHVWKQSLGVKFFDLVVPAQDWVAIMVLCARDPTDPETMRKAMELHL